ncbi:MAG: hypothetical protein VXW65_03950 [Pseudomonadota bacterium]|nr:hypothetical protein [Pseudomonadota bacterium]
MSRLSFSTVSFSLLVGLVPAMAIAADATTTPNTAPENAVEFKQSLPTTMEEVATVDVLREICPKILGEQMQPQFNQGYQNLLSNLLPNMPSPMLGIQSLHNDPEYVVLLDAARAQAASYAVAENRAACLDVVHYPTPAASS